jgi:hypothetical protein
MRTTTRAAKEEPMSTIGSSSKFRAAVLVAGLSLALTACPEDDATEDPLEDDPVEDPVEEPADDPAGEDDPLEDEEEDL